MFKCLGYMFQCLHGLVPQYLQDITFYNMHKDTTSYDLRICLYNDVSLLHRLSLNFVKSEAIFAFF